MFVDLMSDIHTTFTERFFRAQLVFNAPSPPPPPPGPPAGDGASRVPKRRYNALGVLEDVSDEAPVAASDNGGDTTENTHKPAPAPATAAAAPRPDPTVVGAGRARKLSDFDKARASGPRGAAPVESEWGSVGRNDPCPCGSGRKYKKCHGA